MKIWFLGVKGNILRIPMVNFLVWELGFFKSLKLWQFQRLNHLDIWIYLCCGKYLNKENKKVMLHAQNTFCLGIQMTCKDLGQ